MADDRRQRSPAALRNRQAILSALRRVLSSGRERRILEIGAGTGEHAAHFCALEPYWLWTPSDPDPDRRSSIAAWAAHLYLTNVAAPLAIDVTTDPESHDLAGYDAVFCANMIHIAPPAATEGLIRMAAAALKADGRLCLYGPFFTEDGDAAPSNLRFDESLRAENPEWGVRKLEDVTRLAEEYGFALEITENMPANNLFLSFLKSPGGPA